MTIWDDISNGFGNATDAAQSALGQIPTALSTVSNYLPSVSSVGNVLGGFGAGVNGTGTAYLQGLQERKANDALMGLGQDLANGNIDQGQYLKSIAQYSPETYNKMLVTQMQAKPAAQKNFEDLQALVKNGEDAQAEGDIELARNYYGQADVFNGIIHPQNINTNVYSSRLSGQPTQPASQPIVTAPNTNAVTTGTYPSLSSPNAVASGNIAPLAGSNVPTPANEVLNNTAGQTPAEKAAAMLPSENSAVNPTAVTAPIVSPLPQPPKSPEPQPGQTILQQKLAQKKYEVDNAAYLSEQKASGPDTVAYDKDITKRANVSSNMIQLITEMQDAQKNFKAGALAPAQATILKWASAFGKELSPEEVASLSSQQAFNKWTNTLVGQAAKAEGGASRLQAAYTGIVGSTPNTSLQPETLDKLFPAMLTTAAQDINEQKAWAAQKTANPSLTGGQFRRQYESEHNVAQEKAGGNLPGYAGNPNTVPAGLPQGTKSNPDGTLTLPDGRIVRKKQ